MGASIIYHNYLYFESLIKNVRLYKRPIAKYSICRKVAYSQV
jgi:hypothetical protein